MALEFLGRGWTLPVLVDGDGAVVEASEETKVRQSIETILRTAPGERPMRPTFGCGIHELVFESVSDAMIGRLLAAVTSALTTWEPRIDVLGVDAQTDPDDPTRMLVEIDYRVRSTNSRQNLVFPFYVQ